LIEIAFKDPRRECFRNPRGVKLSPGDYCIVQAERGEDLGRVVRLIAQYVPKRNVKLRDVLRLASESEIEELENIKAKEENALEICKQKVDLHSLPMKVVGVECQFDGNKATFFFTSEQRVDFRLLVKDLAATFKTRIELRQIGARDEARRFPGFGICGKRTCCTEWLREFEPVSLKMAKEQNLPLTPSKLTGICGRLMCCMAYELDSYREKTKGLPCIGDKVYCRGQRAKVEKVDVFREEVVLLSKEGNLITLSFEEMSEEMRKAGSGWTQTEIPRDDSPDESSQEPSL
jgi:cell fate regulator YaaT (PSP1 superfamily)